MNFKDIINKGVKIKCSTEQRAKAFLAECEKHKIKWADGLNATEKTEWEHNKSETCYLIRDNKVYFCGCSFFSFLADYDYSDIEDLPKFVYVEINPDNIEQTYEAVDEFIQQHEYYKKHWTDEEIEEAKRISREIVLELFDKELTPVFDCYKDISKGGCIGVVVCKLLDHFTKHVKTETATSKGEDVPNRDIGKCVALCKLTNRPIPDFILNKNRT